MRLGRDRRRGESELNLVPLIDVILVLIIFFVITTTFTSRSALQVQLPEASLSDDSAQAEALVLQIGADGRIFVGDQEVLRNDVESLKAAINAVAGDDHERPVTLRADGRTPHQAVVTAMDALGQLGFARLSIATEQEAAE
ncbi:ExbD/TolR family protein [Coralloluteibacterium stylophorae]|uniref:Biopolymer transporter ExbD n=1 Tax=Coralloluteibacterium stylophorae TaxID=1776034 RepID=A0A8J8AWI3_9GAMM|nr:biopolymer transporter ExbD [Coralloluteibacterium stylophorae]MBS7455817.1 biopolymer transporter ExbD [Coralloluteibacterium stylophorae]